MKHKLLPFHYFFPCWDIDYVCQNLTEYEIFKMGYSCERSILKNPKSLRNLKQNFDLWMQSCPKKTGLMKWQQKMVEKF